VLDEDELASANVEQSDPDLFRLIIAGRERLLNMVANQEYPFTIRSIAE
jgi:hypothetical protein